MEKLRIIDLIKFLRKEPNPRRTFVNNLIKKETKIKDPDKKEGGDYWISCTSTLANIFKTGDKNLIQLKCDEIQQKIETVDRPQTKGQYQANIDMLVKFEDFDFYTIKPQAEITILKKADDQSILQIRNFPIKVDPNHVFNFSLNEENEIGAVWFISIIEGLTLSELAIFTDIIYRYLHQHYAQHYKINPDYCIAVDVDKVQWLSYKNNINENVISKLEDSIDEFKKYL